MQAEILINVNSQIEDTFARMTDKNLYIIAGCNGAGKTTEDVLER